MKRPVLLLLMLSLSCASLIWTYAADGPVMAKPVIYQGAVVVASDDGNIYALDPVGGGRRWQAEAGKEPNEVFLFDGAVVASTTGCKVVKVGPNGNIIWKLDLNTTPYNATYVYGASANANNIFVAADNGIYMVEKNGSVRSKIASYNASIVTAPLAGPDYVVYGRGRELARVSETGVVQWSRNLTEGSYWLSRPTLEGGVIYVGALDNRMHAYVASNGVEVWSARARGWVVGSPLVRGGSVYFGSNDGALYSVDSGNGRIEWAAQTPLAIQSQPDTGVMGGVDAVFVGGTDRSIYAMSRRTGEIIWKGSAAGAVGSPIFHQNMVIFGSSDGKVSAYSTERACSITTPSEADIVGLKELVVSGKYASEAGGATVMVRINTGPWIPSETMETGWSYYLNPEESLVTGLNTISCKCVDFMGEEAGPVFTTVTINHNPAAPLSNLIITASPDILEGQDFIIYVNDGDDGSPVDRFSLTIAGREYEGDKNVTLSIPEPGDYELVASKMGFRDARRRITVNAAA